MKTNILILSLVIATTSLMAQTYYAINFTGTGANPSSVLVENLTKGTTVSLQGTDTLHLDLGTGIHKMQAPKNKLSIYPNPMDQSCTFEFFHAEKGMVAIRLFSVEGRLIHRYSEELAQGKHRFLLSGVPAGVYVISIISGGEHISGRFVSTAQSGGVFSLRYIEEDQSVSIQKRTTEQPQVNLTASMTEGSKSIVIMGFSQGDQLRFAGSATGFPNDTIYASPTGNQTINFVFIGLPTVTTDTVTSITFISALAGGNVISDGGTPVTARGVCWSTSPNPTIADSSTSDGSGIGSFSSTITGLASGNTYYLRAYATNSQGTAYGNQISFVTTVAFNCGVSTVSFNYNGSPVTYGTVIGQNGTCWLDRNLGATQVATSSTDTNAYGDLFLWGRGTDGHQLRNSGTTTVLSNQDSPGHGLFILSGVSTYANWRHPANDSLWQGVNGINNPCPSGYRLPKEAEWNSERLGWSSNNSSGAYASSLKLPAGGTRNGINGAISHVGWSGGYWSSTVSWPYALRLSFNSPTAIMAHTARSSGLSVRCIKDLTGFPTVTTNIASSLSPNTAISGGNVLNDGGYPVTARGVCWSTNPNPTVADSHTNDGADTGTFTSHINGLNLLTKYYIRAFAINMHGVVYGNQVSVISYPIVNPGEVLNPTTGKIWMDRNLGASQVATSTYDTSAHGYLYQWGRGNDGHQIRTSNTTTNLSNSDVPGHGEFILFISSPGDWRSPQNSNLWQGLNGINNPCPGAYRLPTEVELEQERLSWTNNSYTGAFNTPLRLTSSGYRNGQSGLIATTTGYYWSSTINGTTSLYLYFTSMNAFMHSAGRAQGNSVRCVRD